MAFNPESSTWETGIYQWETTDPLQGGLGGVDNVPTVQLGNRTKYLKDRLDILETYKKKFSAVVVISADVTLTSSDYGKLYVVSGSSGVVSITLPAIVAGQEGFGISFENKSSYAVDVFRNGADTVDLLSSKQLPFSGDSMDLVVDESATNFVVKSLISKTDKIATELTLATQTTTSGTYVDMTGLTYTTPNDGVTRKYKFSLIGDAELSAVSGTSAGVGGKFQIYNNSDSVSLDIKRLETSVIVTAGTVDVVGCLSINCSTIVTLAPNKVIKCRMLNDADGVTVKECKFFIEEK